MAWLGIADQSGGRFDPSGLGCGGAPADTLQTEISRGTLILETRLPPEKSPQTLLAFRHQNSRQCLFSLQMLPDGTILHRGAEPDGVRHSTLSHDPCSRTDFLRLTYSWDRAGDWGQLTLELPETGKVQSVRAAPLDRVRLQIMQEVICKPERRELHPEVSFFALSSRIEPVGPMPGLTGTTPIITPNGPVFADRLRRGDLVTTASGAQVPVLQTVRRSVPARGSFRPVLIRAPYFGARQDIVLAPQQRLVLEGSEVEYMFGKEAVLAPAWHLVNGISARFADSPDLITYHHLLLPEHEAILAADCPVESLFVGRLRRKPDQLAMSVLAGAERSRLPEHPQPVWPVLKPFEAKTLAMHRAA